MPNQRVEARHADITHPQDAGRARVRDEIGHLGR